MLVSVSPDSTAYKEMNMFCRIFQMFGVCYPVPKGIKGTLGFIGQIIRNSLFVFPWFLQLVSVYFEGFRQSMSGNAFYLVIGFVTSFKMITFFIKRNDIHDSMNILEKTANSRRMIWEKEFINKRTAFARKVMKIYQTLMISIGQFLYLVFPLVNEILELVGIESLNMTLPFSSLSVEGPNKAVFDKLLVWASMGWYFLGNTFYGCTHTVCFTFTLYTAAEIELICEKLKRLSLSVDVEYYKVNTKAADNGEITLSEIIKHHQFVLKLSKKFINHFGLVFAVENTMVALGLCLNLITIRFQINDQGVAILAVVILAGNGIQPMGTFYFGNYLTVQSILIYERLYELPWYSLPPLVRKTINIMSAQASRRIVIHFCGLAPITLRTYSQLMNAAYSYFTLMSSLLDE